jgi:hypothetical protein
MPNPCAGDRTIAEVHDEMLERADGKPDRKVTVVRDCGHSYYSSIAIGRAAPEIGTPAMQCLGPDPVFATNDS